MFVETKRDGEQQATQSEPSIAGLVAWLETKNPSETYDWGNCSGGCLIGQYLKSVGIEWDWMVANRPGLYNKLVPHGLALLRPHTFGAALERAKSVLAAQ